MIGRIWTFFVRRLGWRRRVLSRDTVDLRSTRLGLVGRPDRIERWRDGAIIPFEKKSWATEVHPNIRIQVCAHLLLVEDVYGVRPPYGWAVLDQDKRHRVGNTPKLRQAVLRTANMIRQHRRQLHTPAKVTASAAQCRGCGYRTQCDQSRA